MKRRRNKYPLNPNSNSFLHKRANRAKSASLNKNRTNRGSLLTTSDSLDIGRSESSSSGRIYSFDGLLEKSRTQWQFGEWGELRKLSFEVIESHPDRAKLALLAAAAYFQEGEISEGRRYLHAAREWGCSSFHISQILVAGVHNSIGRAWSASNENNRADKNFEASITIVTPNSRTNSLVKARAVHQTAQMGFLPQAAGLIEQNLTDAKSKGVLISERAEILQSELDLLKSELSLAQKRKQVYPVHDDKAGEGTVNNTKNNIETIKKRATSQLGQDVWVLEKTNLKRNGFFVEFGAADGVLLSNTWLLENDFEWQGICAEPNPKLFNKLKENRNCVVSSDCIAGETGRDVDFILAEEYGSIADYADIDQHKNLCRSYASQGNVIRVKTISLHDFLVKHNAPMVIDYMSIDTEGNEMDILRGFPFEKWTVNLITVEHNYTEQREDIKSLLEGYGYHRTEAQWDDWYEICSK